MGALRKLKKEKDIRNTENLKYIPKIGNSFTPVNVTNCSAKAASVNEYSSANLDMSTLPALANVHSPERAKRPRRLQPTARILLRVRQLREAMMGLESHRHLSRLSSLRVAPVPQRLYYSLGIPHCGGRLRSSTGKRRSTGACSFPEPGCQVSGIGKGVRTTMSQTRLSALSLFAIGHELVSTLDFEDIVHQFAHPKSRKMPV